MIEALLVLGILLVYLIIFAYSIFSKKAFVRAETPMEQLKRMRTNDYYNNPVVNELRSRRNGSNTKE